MICFTWWGLTQYAARAIEAFVRLSTEKVEVVATKPSSPVKGLDEVLSCPIHWVTEQDTDALSRLSETPRVVFISNWNLPVWRPIEKAVKTRGGTVISMVDTNYKLSWRQFLGAIRFRLLMRRRFDKMLVPGRSGERLARLYGMRPDEIYQGLYCGDDKVFFCGEPLAKRDKKIVYVGQFIERKNVRRMCEAFARIVARWPEWSLELYGAGPLLNELLALAKRCPAIHVHDFAQVAELAEVYRRSRVFILPSLEEHWGVVVHEAALSGCFLLLSDQIGAADDFAGSANARRFDPFSVDSIAWAMSDALSLSESDLIQAMSVSSKLAAGFGPRRFAESVRAIVK